MKSLCKLPEIKIPKVNYMHSVFVYIFLNSNFKTKFDMCYFADKDIIFQRVSLNCDHSKYVINNNNVKSFHVLSFLLKMNWISTISILIISKQEWLKIVKN